MGEATIPDVLAVAERLRRTWLDTFWVPEHVEVHRAGELFYLSCPLDVPPYNMVVGMPEELRAEHVERLLEAHAGRTSRVLVFGDRPDAVEVLAAAGYAPAILHHAWAVRARAHRAHVRPGITARETRSPVELDEGLAVNDAAFGKVTPRTQAEREGFLRDCTGPDRRVVRFNAYEDGVAVAMGGVTLYPKLDVALLWAGGTRPEARRRGAYSAVLAARVRAASTAGISTVGVYARDDTSGPVVAAQGFERLEAMVAWERT